MPGGHQLVPSASGACIYCVMLVCHSCAALLCVVVVCHSCVLQSCACRKIKPVKPSTWSAKEILGMKREALLDCFATMKACYGRAWARTSVDLAIEVGLQSSGNATPSFLGCLAARKGYMSLPKCLQ